MKYRIAGFMLIAGIVYAQGTARRNDGGLPELTVVPDNDGFLLHRGSGDDAEAVVANSGGVGLQERSYELRSWLPNFVLIRRGDDTYLIEDLETVRQTWKLWDESSSCRAAIQAATPTLNELQKALAVCKISAPDLAAAQKLRENLEPSVAWRWNVIEIITQSQIWNAFDRAVESGRAHSDWAVKH